MAGKSLTSANRHDIIILPNGRGGSMNDMCKQCKNYIQHYKLEGGMINNVYWGHCIKGKNLKTIANKKINCEFYEIVDLKVKKKKELALYMRYFDEIYLKIGKLKKEIKEL